MDPCAPQRLIISSDSTFQTYTAYTLTPAVFYGSPTPPYFSSYRVEVTFPPGESFVTIANVDSYGSPHVPEEHTGSLSLQRCESTDGFLHFADQSGRPTVAVRGLPYETLANGSTSASIHVMEAPLVYSQNNRQAALMKRLAILETNLSTLPAPVTVRYYLQNSDLTDTDQAGGSTRTWYKRNGSAQDFIHDFSTDGSMDPSQSVILTPIYGISEGVPYVEFQNLTSFSSIGMISTQGSLPVRLADFHASHEGSSTLLKWKTTLEHDFSHFDIQRSADAKTWSEIGTLPGLNIGSSYSFTDVRPIAGLNYYRLNMTDRDGSSEFSGVVSIEHKTADWAIYPNPASTHIALTEGGITSQISSISITDAVGIPRIQLQKPTTSTVDISRLIPGIYQVKISFGDGSYQSKKLVVAPR
jgi:hypothetical protein